ncbi:hypothetical protein MTO96_008082 [Rhipicephalus appendiculatus]
MTSDRVGQVATVQRKSARVCECGSVAFAGLIPCPDGGERERVLSRLGGVGGGTGQPRRIRRLACCRRVARDQYGSEKKDGRLLRGRPCKSERRDEEEGVFAMHLHFERSWSSRTDCSVLSLTWMGKVPDELPEEDGWRLNRVNYYQDGWLASGNARGIVGVTFTTCHCRKTAEHPQRTNYNLRGHRSEVSETA